MEDEGRDEEEELQEEPHTVETHIPEEEHNTYVTQHVWMNAQTPVGPLLLTVALITVNQPMTSWRMDRSRS